MIGSSSNTVLRFEFICNKCQCFYFDLCLWTSALVMSFSQFLISVEILHLEIFH